MWKFIDPKKGSKKEIFGNKETGEGDYINKENPRRDY